MPTATLTFQLPEEQEEFTRATQAGAMHSILWDTSQEIFRPARKHGYSDSRISELIESIGEDKAEQLIGLLEERFHALLSAEGVTL